MEKIIKLEYPVEYEKDGAKAVVSEIKLVRLQLKDFKKFPKELTTIDLQNSESVEFILSIMNDLPVDVIGKIDMLTDSPKIMKELESFLK